MPYDDTVAIDDLLEKAAQATNHEEAMRLAAIAQGHALVAVARRVTGLKDSLTHEIQGIHMKLDPNRSR
jgi:hypothetical protein